MGSKKPYFGIKWQAFSLTSLVLGAMFVTVLIVLTNATEKQFRAAMNTIFERNHKQFSALLDLEGERVAQLAQFAARNEGVTAVMKDSGYHLLEPFLSDLNWNLQVEYGIESVSLVNTLGQPLLDSHPTPSKEFTKALFDAEHHHWQLSCVAFCFIEVGAPILADGNVIGAIVLREPLNNLLLKFMQVTDINTALLSPRYERFNYVERLKEWELNLVSLTNPETMRPVIDQSLANIDPENLAAHHNFVTVNESVYHLRSFELSNNHLMMIRDVSEGRAIVEGTIANMRWMLAICLIVAECLLLLVLWRPMTRLRKTTNILPSLANSQYLQARKDFARIGKNRLLSDETDILRETATQLANQLENMQGQLESRATELEKRGRDLELERDFVNQLFDTMHAVIIIQDRDGYIRQANQYAEAVTGFDRKALKGSHFAKLLDPTENLDDIVREIKTIAQKDFGEYQHEAAIQTQDHRLRFLAWRHVPLINQKTGSRQILSTAVDISGRIEAETELAWLAQHDSLSGLFNRHAFEETLAKCFAEDREEQIHFGVMFIDLDDFKIINDTHGHSKGDEMIIAVSEAIRQSCRESDFAARMGGDEFALIIRNFHHFDLQRICKRLMRKLTEIRIDPDICCSASIGVAIQGTFTSSPQALIAEADAAMYQAKQEGKNRYVVFDGSRNRKHQQLD